MAIYGRSQLGDGQYAESLSVSESGTTTATATASASNVSVAFTNPNAGIYSRGQYGDVQYSQTAVAVSDSATSTASVTASGIADPQIAEEGVSAASATASAGSLSITTSAATTATASASGELLNVIQTEDIVEGVRYGEAKYGAATLGTPAGSTTASASSGGVVQPLAVNEESTETVTVTVEGVETIPLVSETVETTASATVDSELTIGVSGDTQASAASSGVVTFPVLPSGTSLYIDRLKRDRYAIASAVVSEYPDIARGETATFELRIDGDDRQPRSEAYNRLKDLETYAGFAQTGRTLSDVYFSETASYSDEPIDTLLLRIEPGNKIDAPGVWGVVESIEDSTQVLATGGKLTLDVFVIDRLSEYADQQAVRNDVEV